MKTECAYDYVKIGESEKLCGDYGEGSLMLFPALAYLHKSLVSNNLFFGLAVSPLFLNVCWDVLKMYMFWYVPSMLFS